MWFCFNNDYNPLFLLYMLLVTLCKNILGALCRAYLGPFSKGSRKILRILLGCREIVFFFINNYYL